MRRVERFYTHGRRIRARKEHGCCGKEPWSALFLCTPPFTPQGKIRLPLCMSLSFYIFPLPLSVCVSLCGVALLSPSFSLYLPSFLLTSFVAHRLSFLSP